MFLLDGWRYALPLAAVNRAVHAVEVAPLPGAPGLVLGIIDVGGAVIPVVSLRRRFALRDRPVRVSDHFLLADAARRTVALVVDDVQGVIACDPSATVYRAPPARDAPIEGVVRLDDGLVLIHDLTKLLSIADIHALEESLAAGAHAA